MNGGWAKSAHDDLLPPRRRRDADLQDENTTVFTWEEFTSGLFTTTDQPFDSHREYNELQTDQNPLLYVVSAAAVFLAYVLHLGFAPALFLGRLANLLLFAALAALAVKVAPFGKRVFTVAGAATHDACTWRPASAAMPRCWGCASPLRRCCWMRPSAPKSRRLSPLPAGAAAGLWCAAGPRQACLPAAGRAVAGGARSPAGPPRQSKKCGYLAVCLALALLLNTGLLADTLHSGAGEQTETSETTETTAEAENIEDTDRTPKGRPEERDADYEVEICTVNTTENFLRRLYYFIDNTRDPAQSELDFWVAGSQ